MQTDEQTIDMFCNWLHHYRQLKLPNPVYVVAYGSAAGKVGARNFENVSFVAPPRMDRLGGARGGAGGIGAQNFGSSAFYALNTAKIKVAAQLVRSTRRPVVFTDVDTALRRDPFALLQDLFAALPPSKVFAIAPDQNERDPLRTGVCACFFAACANHAGERVLHRWWNASGGFASTVNEQKAFNRLVDKEPELLAGPVALLPYTHFAEATASRAAAAVAADGPRQLGARPRREGQKARFRLCGATARAPTFSRRELRSRTRAHRVHAPISSRSLP